MQRHPFFSPSIAPSPNTATPANPPQEAKRLDDQTRITLLNTRKLSLIVDLDQTIIHTTVDPTVGEWIDEIAAQRGAEQAVSSEEAVPEEREAIPVNPNEEALKDVASFALEDELPLGARRGMRAPDRTYYTKPR